LEDSERIMKNLLPSVLWGLLIWVVLTFLMGAVWGMTHNLTDSHIGFLSSNVLILILLPPSLVLAIILVAKRQTQFIKKSLISIILALALWAAVAILAVIIMWWSGIPRETARNSLHILNPILLGVVIACSAYLVFGVYPRLKRREAGRNQ
jgi:cytochrome bd-type quinol oxidase subunit 2